MMVGECWLNGWLVGRWVMDGWMMKEKTTFCLGLPISRNPSGQDEASWETKLGTSLV